MSYVTIEFVVCAPSTDKLLPWVYPKVDCRLAFVDTHRREASIAHRRREVPSLLGGHTKPPGCLSCQVYNMSLPDRLHHTSTRQARILFGAYAPVRLVAHATLLPGKKERGRAVDEAATEMAGWSVWVRQWMRRQQRWRVRLELSSSHRFCYSGGGGRRETIVVAGWPDSVRDGGVATEQAR